MKNQIGLQSKRLAQMKIEEERRRKTMNARRDHENRCDGEEQLRNIKMDEVAQMEKLEMELIKRLQKKCIAVISLFLNDFDLVIYVVQLVLLHFILKLLYFNHHFFIFVVNYFYDFYDFLLFFLYWAGSKEIVVGVTLQHVVK